MKNKNILVADKFFNLKPKNFNLIAVFPDEFNNNCYKVTYEEYKNRALSFKNFNLKFILILEKFFKDKNLSKTEINYRIILHPFIDVFINIFTDRLIRVKFMLKKNDINNIVLGDIKKNINKFSTLQEISNLSHSSWDFNQYIINKFLLNFGVKKKFYLREPYPPLFPQSSKGYMNLTSGPIISNTLDLMKVKIFSRISNFFQSFNFIKNNRYQSLGFAGIDYFFGLNFFYGPFGFFSPKKYIKLDQKITSDKKLRKELCVFINESITTELEFLLKNLKPNFFTKKDLKNINNVFSELLSEIIPKSFFENLDKNVTYLAYYLKRSNGIIGTLVNTDYGLISASLAKALNKEVLGVQHGGHYGYVESMSLLSEQEYIVCDKYLSWGWNKFEQKSSKCIVTPLPSPRLSEFSISKKLKPKIIESKILNKKIIFMPNLISRFPKAGTCGHAHIDFIEEIMSEQKKIIKTLSQSKIKIFYKPHSPDIYYFFKKSHEKFKLIGKNYFKLYLKNQKGLDPKITKEFPIILWDQLGSGAIECFVSEVPTIIYWKNIYSKETDEAKKVIEKLKIERIIVDNDRDLVETLNDFYLNPKKWMECQTRQKAIKEFCTKYGLFHHDWKKIWSRYLKANLL